MAGYFIGEFFVWVKNRGKRVTWHVDNVDGKHLESGTCDAELAYVQILRALETVQQPGYSKNWGESGRNGSLR